MEQKSLTLRECLIGDRTFYRHVAVVVLPIIVQNTLSNVVSLLDNVMVGQVGTLPMSGVAVVGQLLFVYNLAIWGSTSGAGIFGAQFYGRGDMDGVRHTFRFKLLVSTVITAAAIMLFLAAGPALIGAYISADTSPADAAATLDYAWGYLRIMLVGLVPFGLTQCYAGTLRESGQTVLPMKASMLAMVVNFIFNALLIFGLGPFPRLGVAGAAIATVLSRFVELAIVATGAHRSADRYPFMHGVYHSLAIPGVLVKSIFIRSMPLLANELMWGAGQAVLLQCYSVRGIQAVAALNICNTIAQIFNEVFLSLGNATAIVVGQELGYYGQGLTLTAADGSEQTLPEKPILLESGVSDEAAAAAEEELSAAQRIIDAQAAVDQAKADLADALDELQEAQAACDADSENADLLAARDAVQAKIDELNQTIADNQAILDAAAPEETPAPEEEQPAESESENPAE